jgi:putative DNA primase/helicase
LISETSEQRFVVLFGPGQNGKGVLVTVFIALLGQSNLSHISLEAFNPTRTYPLAQTLGKLANISTEIGEMSKTAEGLLKQFTAGEPIQVEEKYKAPFTLYPTARLTFATNVLPRFIDRSQGLWRRLVILPFTNTIKEEDKDPKLVKPSFWADSGEMPGVLIWALEGLKRLKARGTLMEPNASKALKEAHRLDCNPADLFLTDEFQVCLGSKYSVNTLYHEYAESCRNGGFHPLNRVHFCNEVKSKFPSVYQEKNATRNWPSNGRSRGWVNLKRKVDSSLSDTSDTFGLSKAEQEEHNLRMWRGQSL